MAKAPLTPPNAGRKRAYVARNRTKILSATQLALAEIGPQVTIEQVAEMAEMSVSTLYLHFKDKEDLFATAIEAAFSDWENWKDDQLSAVTDPLTRLILPMRLFVRVGTTHPTYGKLASRNFPMIGRLLPNFGNRIFQEVQILQKVGVITVSELEIRVQNVIAVLFSQLQQQLLNPKAKPSDSDVVIIIALSMLGISESEAKKAISAKLPPTLP